MTSAVIALRSFLFNAVFYVVLIVYLLATAVTLVMPRAALLALLNNWSRLNSRLLRLICGVKVEIAGLEKIPSGAMLVAAKHQSLWETFALIPLFRDPTFVLKRELMLIPFFGWAARHAQMIPVDRGARSVALMKMTEQAKFEARRGRQIVIFPEGTRCAPGAAPKYKFGAAHLYAELGIPCVPVALNSGLFWPRRSFLRYPGTIRVEILDPIMPGLDKAAFAQLLQERMEEATARLVAQGRRELTAAHVS